MQKQEYIITNMATDSLRYAGFWPRVGACIVDSVILFLISAPILLYFYGSGYYFQEEITAQDGFNLFANKGFLDIFMSWVFPVIFCILFWIYKSATPGKMLFNLLVVDVKTGAKITIKQALLRYVGYFPSIAIFCLGLLWVAFDKKKQGWHDKIAKTCVINQD